MKFANATNLDRKSGGAQWRDLRFAFGFKRMPVGESSPGSVFPSRQTAGPSTAQRSGRDDKVEGGGSPWHGWKWMDRVKKANLDKTG